jgi:hypothetical protein
MPFAMRKLRSKPLYKVYNRITKKVYSKGTTKEKAERQLRLLRAIEYNPAFVPRERASATTTTTDIIVAEQVPPRGARARAAARTQKIKKT